MKRLHCGLIVGAWVLLCSVSAARADFSDVVFSVEATNDAGSGTFEVFEEDLVFNPVQGIYTWSLPSEVTIMDGMTPVAVLQGANIAYQEDPALQIGFTVLSGTSDTEFVVKSALLSFSTIPADLAEGRASAGYTVTDLTGDGASVMGVGAPGTGIYRADYNGFVPTGETFSSLVATVSAGPFGTGTGSQNDPPGVGFRPVGDDVFDMSAQSRFVLTAGDAAGSTANFIIVPEPASIAAFLMLLPVVLRRRA
jgi:hypothetical protein